MLFTFELWVGSFERENPILLEVKGHQSCITKHLVYTVPQDRNSEFFSHWVCELVMFRVES